MVITSISYGDSCGLKVLKYINKIGNLPSSPATFCYWFQNLLSWVLLQYVGIFIQHIGKDIIFLYYRFF